MLADEFNRAFRSEHRAVRDVLLDVVEALRNRDRPRAGQLLARLISLTGPHFRYEEESLYPALVEIYGLGYVKKLLADHDKAIGIVKRLVEIVEDESLEGESAEEAIRLVRGVLPHVSDCDGLSIMVERLPQERVEEVLAIRERALSSGLDLLAWAEQVRRRRSIPPRRVHA